MMPIGVPKVAYRPPGAYSADWVDLYNRLYRERIIFLGQQIADDIANQIIGVMLYLDSEETAPMYMYINSPGGSVTAGFAMFDTMRHVKSEVSTINVGLAASMGSLLLVGGAKGKRLALPHSRAMIHQPAMGGIEGQASDIKVEAEMILGIRERVVTYYSQLSGQTREKVAMDLDRDSFLSAQEALEYGLIDSIVSG
jgi:ATP-dependent Clp endopeptidase proteolytic subunit ClpP